MARFLKILFEQMKDIEGDNPHVNNLTAMQLVEVFQTFSSAIEFDGVLNFPSEIATSESSDEEKLKQFVDSIITNARKAHPKMLTSVLAITDGDIEEAVKNYPDYKESLHYGKMVLGKDKDRFKTWCQSYPLQAIRLLSRAKVEGLSEDERVVSAPKVYGDERFDQEMSKDSYNLLRSSIRDYLKSLKNENQRSYIKDLIQLGDLEVKTDSETEAKITEILGKLLAEDTKSSS